MMKKIQSSLRSKLRVIHNPIKAPPKNSKTNITLVASGKGGVGKTWFSITLSHALAQKGKQILLLDGDLEFANIDIQLGLMPDHDLEQVLTNKVSFKNAITSYKQGGFDVLVGHSGGGKLSVSNSQKVMSLKESLKKICPSYDHIFMDLGTGDSQTIKGLSDVATHCIIIIMDEPTSLTDAYALIKSIHLASPSMDIDVIVNQAESELGGRRAYNTLLKVCENFLGLSPHLLGIIRRDKKVKESICSQSSLLDRFPSSPAAKDIKKLSEIF